MKPIVDRIINERDNDADKSMNDDYQNYSSWRIIFYIIKIQ